MNSAARHGRSGGRRLRATVALLFWGLVPSAFAVLPATTAVSNTFGRGPLGDAPLFRPSAFALTGAVFRQPLLVLSWLATLVAVLTIAGTLGALVTAHATAILGGEPGRRPLPRVFEHPWRYILGGLAATLLQLLLLSFTLFVAVLVYAMAEPSMSDPRATALAMLPAAVGIALAVWAGITFELFVARLLTTDELPQEAFARAALGVVSAPFQLLFGWGGRQGVALGLVVAGAHAADGAPSSVLFAGLVHLSVLVGLSLLRVSWLERVLEEATRAAVGRSVRTVEPLDPSSDPAS